MFHVAVGGMVGRLMRARECLRVTMDTVVDNIMDDTEGPPPPPPDSFPPGFVHEEALKEITEKDSLFSDQTSQHLHNQPEGNGFFEGMPQATALTHFNKDRPKRKVQNPSREKLRSASDKRSLFHQEQVSAPETLVSSVDKSMETNEHNIKLPVSDTGSFIKVSTPKLLDTVIQAKPTLSTSLSTSDVGKKVKPGVFSARLKKIRETRVPRNGNDSTSTEEWFKPTYGIEHTVSSPNITLSHLQATAKLPESKEDISISISTQDDKSNASTVEQKNKSLDDSFGIFSDLETSNSEFSGYENLNLTPMINGGTEHVKVSLEKETDSQLKSLQEDTTEDHIYEIAQALDDFPALVDLPPLPSSPPPSLPASPPPDVIYEIFITEESIIEQNSMSPMFSPGYDVQFSTEGGGSSTTVTTSDEQLLALDYNHTDSVEDLPTIKSRKDRPQSVSSLSQDLPFKSNLKRWDVTNLTELDGTRGENKDLYIHPTSNKMRHIYSSIDIPPRTRSSSSVSRISGGANQSLDSISEIHHPDSPVQPPALIQERLASGNIFDGEFTITQVAKTSWSNKNHHPIDVDPTNIEDNVTSITPLEKNTGSLKLLDDSREMDVSFQREPTEELQMRKKRQKRVHSLHEESLKEKVKLSNSFKHPHHELYDLEGEARGEGNLNKIAQDIPKTMSSLFDAVVSDIPTLVDSSDEEESESEEVKEKKVGEEMEVSSREDIFKTETKGVAKNIETGGHWSKLEVEKMDSNALTKTSEHIESKATARYSSSQTKKVSPVQTVSYKEEELQFKKATLLQKRSTLRKSETHGIMKIYMEKIHPGLFYKMLRIGSHTTAEEVVVQSLDRANIIEDHHCFAIYQVYDSSQEAIRVLQEQDCPLSLLASETAPTHWELRRCRIHQSRTIQISTEHLAGVRNKTIFLTISPLTTSSEVVQLALKKLNILNTEDMKQADKYKLMTIEKKCNDEWLLEDEKYILDELNGDCVCYLVDIMEYLMKGDEDQRRVVEEMFPEDPDVAKVMLKQCQDRIIGLQREIVVKDYTLEQLKRALEDARTTNQELQEYQKTLEKMDTDYKEYKKSTLESTGDLHQRIAQMCKERKENAKRLSNLQSQKQGVEDMLKNKDTTISDLQSSIKQIHDSKTSNSSHGTQEDDGKHISSVVESLQQERDSLSKKTRDLERENKHLKTVLQDMKTTESVNVGDTSIQPSLFSLLGSTLKQILVSIEAVPTEQGLGVKLSNNPNGNGCIIKTVAESSSARGILLPGDKLLEISDHIVSNQSHKEIVNILQSHSGPVKMVVSRSIHNEGEESGRREKEMELFKVNQNLEQKLSQQLSLINEWKQKNEKLREELNTLSSIRKQLHERENEVEMLKEKCQKITQENDPIKDIHSLRKYITANELVINKDDVSECLTDTLKDASRGEILNALQTVETDCLQQKESLNRLLAIVVEHNPDLLSLMVESQQDRESEEEEEEEEDEEDLGWC